MSEFDISPVAPVVEEPKVVLTPQDQGEQIDGQEFETEPIEVEDIENEEVVDSYDEDADAFDQEKPEEHAGDMNPDVPPESEDDPEDDPDYFDPMDLPLSTEAPTYENGTVIPPPPIANVTTVVLNGTVTKVAKTDGVEVDAFPTENAKPIKILKNGTAVAPVKKAPAKQAEDESEAEVENLDEKEYDDDDDDDALVMTMGTKDAAVPDDTESQGRRLFGIASKPMPIESMQISGHPNDVVNLSVVAGLFSMLTLLALFMIKKRRN